MMEALDPSGQEEYIWAMRYRGRDSDRNLQRDKLMASDSTMDDEKYLKVDKSVKGLVHIQDDHQTKVLASLVPDEIIYNVNDYTHRHYDACLLFGDVSGFTDLCEKYNKTGKGGPSRLTQVLNSYIGSMVQEIMSYNGDVLKFSGDAFLAMWKSSSTISMQDCVHDALDCALIIQKTYGSYETDVGVFLRVKLAISAGYVIFSLIGDERFSHYVVMGQPIWDVKAAEHKSSAGEIIVSHTAWNYINPSEYLYQPMSDGLHIKVLGLGANWRSTQKSYRQNKSTNSARGIKDDLEMEDSDLDLATAEEKLSNDEFSIRPSVNDAAKLKLKEDLRKFIIPPVMRAVDEDEPVEYLTEMRQIVILFINVVTHKIDLPEFVNLVDKCYKIVCGIVDSMHGCVNKVSLFDKDLMFVVIFGFRGFKHELESQVGLRCATECYQSIARVKHVKSTSIGVTTGMTYCGVVGHTLRREYTVISLNVNKAARLMVAYPNKVTCDVETFLHSKLESRNFILQEHKDLKGITRAGPVYEFKEVNVVERTQHNIHRFPILGRDNELRLYLKMLRNNQEYFRKECNTDYIPNRHTALLLKGDARQGLTRLLDEMVYCTPPNVPINRFSLNSADRKIPFLTIQLIFSSATGITETSTDKDKREKLLRRLKKVDVPELFCVLNNIFSVNFEMTPLYFRCNMDQRRRATQRMLKQLAYGCFTTLWVIALDGAEHIDNESWDLMKVLFDLDILFIIMTIGNIQQKAFCKEAEEMFMYPRLKILNLPSIDKWFHAGLACQTLGVFAIPPELEKVIQMKSNGNPGWIENYLLSLNQGGGLQIKNVFKGDVNELGMVVPPVEMFERQPPDIMRAMLEERHDSGADTLDKNDDMQRSNYGWRMFQHCFRDSHTNLMRLRLQTSYIGDAPICFITPGYKIEEVDPEMPMDVFIMKTFDSLTSFEQQLLKCSAVLGETFPRDMLVYILGSAQARPTALAVLKLFEHKILTCAQGDFTQGDSNLIFRQRLSTTQMTVVKCECRGLKIHESCMELPKYASCGYMRFRLPMFREITYNLLTDNQKKEFHSRAVRYLEKETRRCRSCGNGFFVRFLGTRNDDLRKKLGKFRKSRSRAGSVSSRGSMDFSKRASIQSDVTQVSATSRSISNLKRETVTYGPGSIMYERMDAHYYNEFLKNDICGCTTINRLRRSNSLARTFSNADFTNCQCPQILNSMYSQMLDHCRGAGLVDKLLDTMLEYAYVCILTYNIPHAMRILDDATNFIKSTNMNIEEEEQEWKIPLMIGKIKTLIGNCRLELGQMKEAYECFTQAMVLYGYPFPTNKNIVKCYIKCMEFKLSFGIYVLPRLIYSYVEGYEAEFCDNVSECLSLLCNLFIDLEMWEDAELASVWSLNMCLKSKMDFSRLCIAYGNVIFVAHHMGRKRLSVGLEVHALTMCHRKKTAVESQDLVAVVKMYSAIFSARFVRSEIERTITIGFVLSRICATIHATLVCLKVLPLLVQALLMKKRVIEAASLLHELEYYAEEDIDNSGRTWFYALCVCIHLETGYTVIPFSRCAKFYQIEGETMITIRDPDAERRYYTVMWLWCIRNTEWEAAAVWYTKAKDFTINPDDNLDNAFTALYLLEGLLLYLVCKMDKRNVKSIAHTHGDIKDLISILDRTAKRCQTILPRLNHLKIYFRFIQDSELNFVSLLNSAQKQATNLENLLEVSWMEHSEKAWNNNLNQVTVDFWRDHCDPDNLLDYHEIDFNGGKLGLFTLPQPLYV